GILNQSGHWQRCRDRDGRGLRIDDGSGRVERGRVDARRRHGGDKREEGGAGDMVGEHGDTPEPPRVYDDWEHASGLDEDPRYRMNNHGAQPNQHRGFPGGRHKLPHKEAPALLLPVTAEGAGAPLRPRRGEDEPASSASLPPPRAAVSPYCPPILGDVKARSAGAGLSAEATADALGPPTPSASPRRAMHSTHY